MNKKGSQNTEKSSPDEIEFMGKKVNLRKIRNPKLRKAIMKVFMSAQKKKEQRDVTQDTGYSDYYDHHSDTVEADYSDYNDHHSDHHADTA